MNESAKYTPDYTDSQVVIDEYWERKGKPSFQYTILKKLGELRSKGEEDIRYLIEVFEQYPDAPGVLILLVSHLDLSHDYYTAYIVSKLLVSMYPGVTDFVKKSELIKILLDFQFSQGEEGLREFGEAIDKWAEGVNL
jgi:hypothetical protein